MTPVVQEILALLTVCGAALWLALSWWRRRSQARCDGCSPLSIAARAQGQAVRSRALRVLR